ncbi:MAG: hypothetical protein LQ338_003253 [Usnochroma carphineum]|nr:MAG: hypothetical protein LQ338_003253 [Usnochroma carphineum]
MGHLPEHHLYSAYTRPDWWNVLQDPNHPLNQAWPRFLDNDAVQVQLANNILSYRGLNKYQFAIVEQDVDGRETMVACARSLPFYWPELDEVKDIQTLSTNARVLGSLPDGGWDSIVSCGIRQHCVREGLPMPDLPPATSRTQLDVATHLTTNEPNALSALSITVRADRRNIGLAERLIETMKEVARQEHLQLLVAPLRPTRKSEYPWVPITEYISYTLAEGLLGRSLVSNTTLTAQASHSLDPDRSTRNNLPFDPWLRKHVRLGGSMIKVAPSSMKVQGSFADWQAWTGIDFHSLASERQGKASLQLDRRVQDGYIEVPIDGGLVPLKVYLEQGICEYTEPNVWLYHNLSRP